MTLSSETKSSSLSDSATLYLFCGKIAAGKSTLAAKVAEDNNALLLCEDQWTSKLWPGELTGVEEYVDRSSRLKAVLWPHIIDVLRSGVSVVLDFPANTVRQRAHLKELFEESGANHILYVLDVPDETCRQRLRARNAAGNHDYVVTDAEFDIFTSHFAAPAESEGFTIRNG